MPFWFFRACNHARSAEAARSALPCAARALPLLAIAALAVAWPAGAEAASNSPRPASGPTLADGRRLFGELCTGCHSLTQNRYGPRLGDVYGRRAGAVAGFSYSEVLQGQRFVWSEKSLDAWLSGPGRYLPGARMPVSVADPASRAAVIAYLRSHPAGEGD